MEGTTSADSERTQRRLQTQLRHNPGCLALREAGLLGPTQQSFQRAVSGHRTLLHRLQQQRVLDGHHGCVNTVSFTPDGRTLISGSDDTDIILWDWQTGTQRLKYNSGHNGNVFQAKALRNTDNRVIVSCAADGQVRIGHIPEGATSGDVRTKRIGKHLGRAHKLALELTCDDCFLSSGEDGAVRHFDVREPDYGNRKILDLISYSHGWRRRLQIYALALNPVRPWEMAVAATDENVRVYDFRRSMGGPEANFGPTGDDRQVEILHMLCPEHLRGTADRQSHTTSVAYSCRGELLASYGSEDIYMFDYNTPGTPKHTPATAAMATDLRDQSPQKLRVHSSQEAEPEGAAVQAPAATGGQPPGNCRPQGSRVGVSAAAPEADAAGPSTQTNERQQTLPEVGDPTSTLDGTRRTLLSHALNGAVSDTSSEEGGETETPTPGSRGGDGARSEDPPRHLHPAAEDSSAPLGDSAPGSPESGATSIPSLVSNSSGEDASATPRVVSAADAGARSALAGAVDSQADGMPDLASLSDPDSDRGGDEPEGAPDLLSEASLSDTGRGGEDPQSGSDPYDDDMPGLYSDRSSDSDGPDWRPRSAQGTHAYEEPEPAQGTDFVVQRFSGHSNRRTVKGVNFCGANDEYVISGSDCGNVFIWDKASGQLEWMKLGDDTVVNCLEPHPHLPLHLATSGIDDTIKIWAPEAEHPIPMSQETRDYVRRTASMVQERAGRHQPTVFQWPAGAEAALAGLLQGSTATDLLGALQSMQQAADAHTASEGSEDEELTDDDDEDDDDDDYSGDELGPQCATQ